MLIDNKVKVVSRYIKTLVWLNEISMDHPLYYETLIRKAILYAAKTSNCDCSEINKNGISFFSFDCTSKDAPWLLPFGSISPII